MKDADDSKRVLEFVRDVRFWATVIATVLASMGITQVGTSDVARDVDATASLTSRAVNDHAAHISRLFADVRDLEREQRALRDEIRALREELASKQLPKQTTGSLLKAMPKALPGVVKTEGALAAPVTMPDNLRSIKELAESLR